ncbi:hypothetical protein DFP72DRAFT_860177 [Ephemerocybe angulata]|uniref:Uncharacterized protein n=1 Tax=Ephemerocybe angulata TaxID=980116 RepID=A0A8H6HAT7_9AGAR|nr:hypothetical protein DFP72DRAFT_860177 [Tulosesus angulatus]
MAEYEEGRWSDMAALKASTNFDVCEGVERPLQNKFGRTDSSHQLLQPKSEVKPGAKTRMTSLTYAFYAFPSSPNLPKLAHPRSFMAYQGQGAANGHHISQQHHTGAFQAHMGSDRGISNGYGDHQQDLRYQQSMFSESRMQGYWEPMNTPYPNGPYNQAPGPQLLPPHYPRSHSQQSSSPMYDDMQYSSSRQLPPPRSSSPSAIESDSELGNTTMLDILSSVKSARKAAKEDEPIEIVEATTTAKSTAKKVPPARKAVEKKGKGKGASEEKENGPKGRTGKDNYVDDEDELILAIVREIQPIGQEMWERVAQEFKRRVEDALEEGTEKEYPSTEREATSLKGRFDRQANKGENQRPRTGETERSRKEDLQIQAHLLRAEIEANAGQVVVGGKGQGKADQANTTKVLKAYQEKSKGEKGEKVKEEEDEEKPKQRGPSLSSATAAVEKLGSFFDPEVARERENTRSTNSLQLLQVHQLQNELRRAQERYEKVKDAHIREIMALKDEMRNERDRANRAESELRLMQLASGFGLGHAGVAHLVEVAHLAEAHLVEVAHLLTHVGAVHLLTRTGAVHVVPPHAHLRAARPLIAAKVHAQGLSFSSPVRFLATPTFPCGLQALCPPSTILMFISKLSLDYSQSLV